VVVIHFAWSFAGSKLGKYRRYGRQLIHASIRAISTWHNRVVCALFNALPRLVADREVCRADGRELGELKIGVER